MKPLLLFLCLAALPLVAQQPGSMIFAGMSVNANQGGFLGATRTQALNSDILCDGNTDSCLRQAFSIMKYGTDTLTSAQFRVTAVAGTLTDISLEVQTDNAGVPSGTPITNGTSHITSSLPSGASTVTFDFSSAPPTLTNGTLYWLVLKNNTATPNSNYPTYGFVSNEFYGPPNGRVNGFGALASSGTDGSWNSTNTLTNVAGYMLVFGSGAKYGLPVTGIPAADSSNRIYGSNETGIQFTTPAGVTLKIAGVAGYFGKYGTPTGTLSYKLYLGALSGTTATATTAAIPAANVAGTTIGFFPTPVSVPGGSLVTYWHQFGSR